MTKLKNLKFEKTRKKIKMGQNLKLKILQNSKTQNMTKKTQKIKM